MATQNFVAGGFYGKLGAMVGQRWRNKRIVRAYAVPANPRTPEQQGNRARFAQATAAAQEAMIFNKNAPCWNYEGKTEWMARVGEAKTRIDNGITGWLAVPLYPSGTTPEMTITDIQSATGTSGGILLQSATLATLASPRKFTLQVKMLEQSSGELVNVYLEGATEAGSADLVEITPDSGYSLTEDSTVVGITFDDADNDNKIIYIAPQKIGLPQNITITDAALSYADSTHVLVSSEQARGLGYVYGISVAITLTDGTTGNAKSITATTNNVLGNATLATVEIAATDVLFSNAQAAFTVTSTPSGAPDLAINAATASLGQKEIAVTLASPAASLTAAARKSGSFTANGITAATSNNLALLAKATFTDFKGVAHSDETAANITTQAVTGTGITAALSFSEAPEVFDTATVSVEGSVANTWLKQTFTATANITDSTQQKVTPQLDDYDLFNDYITIIFNITQAQYQQWKNLTFGGSVTGQDIKDGTASTETLTEAGVWEVSRLAQLYMIYLSSLYTAPVTSGAWRCWLEDFATMPTAIYIDTAAAGATGKVSSMGYIAQERNLYSKDDESAFVTTSSGVGYVDLGNLTSSLATTFVMTDTTEIADESGIEGTITPNGTATVTAGGAIHVPLTYSPAALDIDNTTGECDFRIANAMVDWSLTIEVGVN